MFLFLTCTVRNKTLLPSTSLPGMGEVAGFNAASLGRCPHRSKTGQTGGRVPRRTQLPRVRPGEGWTPSGCTSPMSHLEMTTRERIIPDRLPSGSTRTVPSAVHQDGDVKYATGAPSKMRGRNNINIGIWNTRTLRANLHFADDIYGLAGEEKELAK